MVEEQVDIVNEWMSSCGPWRETTASDSKRLS